MNSEITDYEIISTHDINELKQNIRTLLGQGWKLYGDLQIIATVTESEYVASPLFTQAMVKAKLQNSYQTHVSYSKRFDTIKRGYA